MLWGYVNGAGWRQASYMAAQMEGKGLTGKGDYRARKLRQWCHAFIADRHDLPVNFKATWNSSALENEELEGALSDHLQRIGKHVRALDIVEYLADPAVQQRFGLTETLSLSTAHGWMLRLGYRWGRVANGQYIDGHEREDVVHYRQNVYLPTLNALRPQLRQYDAHGNEVTNPMQSLPEDSAATASTGPPSPAHSARLCFYDESIFYANDRRTIRWKNVREKSVPQAKGEGVSMMISDFFTAEDGWLQSRDGETHACIVIRPGARRDGYFTSDNVLMQFKHAARIARENWPDEDIYFIVDNAPTHTKRAPDALSARKMTKGPSRNFGVDIPLLDKNGNPVIGGPKNRPMKTKIPMANATFPDGTPQPLYYPNDHQDPELRGAFKGIVRLLDERGISGSNQLPLECPHFRCPSPPSDVLPVDHYLQNPCCCRRLLYEQPDFRSVKSLLKLEMEACGVHVLFLPKFHCELNPIEQCWGYAKNIYRRFPDSTKEADLEKNMLAAVHAVPLACMRRFSTRALRFADAYTKGLNGKQAAWASRKYKSHRVIPETIFEELTKAGILDESF
ncbi:hypothetical protein DICSQDRAFT_73804 [Dichomitus squalens LYAD-421 SS1]|uniref:Tc1-like transposase DDE domain-containing protein n=1 Tax=Dichomitus squalens (strain LYAD-421) TaxID=732165 RepID=R7SIB9_DICSQ|nr:uncharacterized protein DICSQDRAFT_73804 [Dichomitus squalens LYAD-421 SS1]EJF55475.1 hypothetical protein DICSQDRAFT_73804 [Dichomitus squalens LYAD-421 SS1]